MEEGRDLPTVVKMSGSSSFRGRLSVPAGISEESTKDALGRAFASFPMILSLQRPVHLLSLSSK
jgi:hypothetical protein